MHARDQARTNLRDKLSNGTRLMPGVDLRTAAGRRYRYLVGAYSAELGNELTEPQKALVRQVSSLQIRIEQLQESIVAGADVSADEIIRLNSEHRRLMSTLRGKAETNKPSPAQNLQDYIAQHYGKSADASEADEPA